MGVQLTQEMIEGAQKAQEKYGVPASVTLGQILLESGGSNPGGLSDLAYKENNLFGIKAGSSWKGETAQYKTTEYKNGVAVKETATFRKYDSIADSIDDHGKLLSSDLYTSATKGKVTIAEYVTAMSGVYATDPNYASTLIGIISDNNLTQYDNGYLNLNYKSEDKNSWIDKILSGVVKFIAVVFIGVMAVVLFTQAFNIKIPSKADIVKEVVNDE